MKFALYGLPCSGKTTILSKINIPVINGSIELNRLSNEKFSEMSEIDREKIRVMYAEELSKKSGSFISDGHYAFENNIVFTNADGELYDVFIYLFCAPEIIYERIQKSAKNEKFSHLSVEYVRKWQDFEIDGLREECHKRNKDFYVFNSTSENELQDFIDAIIKGFSSYKLAESIVERICSIYPNPCTLNLCDGDKTVITEDSFRACSNNYVTRVFDGDFYTGYQSLKFTREITSVDYQFEKLADIRLNELIYNRISGKNYIVLSSGPKQIWEKLTAKLKLYNVIADTLISADTKYFVAKLLRDRGYKITAYGDSMIDLYMLKEADDGYLYVGKRLSRSLKRADVSGIKLLYDKQAVILNEVRSDLSEEIAICRSSSGINGARLAASHIRLGQLLGTQLACFVPSNNTAVIILERGGRFFGDGVYTGFGGRLYSINPQTDTVPFINEDIVVIVDSVINTGKSIKQITEKVLSDNPAVEIFVVTNVIQRNALKVLSDYKIFAVRISDNSYVGKKQSVQIGGEGPDTAERLFNFIN